MSLTTAQVVCRLRVAALDPGGFGMRVGVVHASVGAGADWGDFSACNNRSFWWSSTSGSVFVGDVAESFLYVKYNKLTNSLIIFADDTHPRSASPPIKIKQ